jgi:hypothetical protein
MLFFIIVLDSKLIIIIIIIILGSTALYGPGPPLASSFRGY